MNINSTKSSALKRRLELQTNQQIDLNSWIFENMYLDRSEDILELCCGLGNQTQQFDALVDRGTITSVDLNLESINIAKNSLPNNRVKFVLADIDNVSSYATDYYDLIFCSYGFYYSKNPQNLFHELKNRLNSNGRFVLVGPIAKNNLEIFRIVKSIGCSIPTTVLYSSEQFMLNMLNLFLDWFENVTLKRVENKIEYKNPDQLLEYWKNTTFYSVGKDKQFLDKSLEIYPN